MSILQLVRKLHTRREKKGKFRNLSELCNVVHGEGISLRKVSNILMKCKTYV